MFQIRRSVAIPNHRSLRPLGEEIWGEQSVLDSCTTGSMAIWYWWPPNYIPSCREYSTTWVCQFAGLDVP